MSYSLVTVMLYYILSVTALQVPGTACCRVKFSAQQTLQKNLCTFTRGSGLTESSYTAICTSVTDKTEIGRVQVNCLRGSCDSGVATIVLKSTSQTYQDFYVYTECGGVPSSSVDTDLFWCPLQDSNYWSITDCPAGKTFAVYTAIPPHPVQCV